MLFMPLLAVWTKGKEVAASLPNLDLFTIV